MAPEGIINFALTPSRKEMLLSGQGEPTWGVPWKERHAHYSGGSMNQRQERFEASGPTRNPITLCVHCRCAMATCWFTWDTEMEIAGIMSLQTFREPVCDDCGDRLIRISYSLVG